jgi:hypothetical protein
MVYMMGAYVVKNMLQTGRFRAGAASAVCARVLCFFVLEMEEEFMI